jgi:hypothetical protein
MGKKELLFLGVNFFFCILLWILMVKSTYALGIELWRYDVILWIIFPIITILSDWLILRLLGMKKGEILFFTILEVCIIYGIMWGLPYVVALH